MTPYYDDGRGIQIFLGDCRDVLPTIDWRETDLVVSDPPYGTGGWRRHSGGQAGNPSGALVRESWDEGDTAWLDIVKADAVLTFWPPARTCQLLNAAIACGLVKHRALYMRKRDPKPMVQGRTRWSVEPVWVLSRDGIVLVGGDDVCEVSTPRMGRDRSATGHPYEKPLQVMTWLIAKTDRERIIDPFVGSGTTLVAARCLGRGAIGIEQDEAWCETAARRLQQSVLPLEVPA